MSIYNVYGVGLEECYAINRAKLEYAYDKDGNIVYEPTLPVIDYDSYTISDYLTISVANTQGFDIYNGTLFQFRGSSSVHDIMNVYDAETGNSITTGVSISSGHGDSASFSNEFCEIGDNYPLFYVSADTNPAVVYVNRVTEQSSSLIKTLAFPIEQAGYYAAAVCDFQNNTLYMIGYTEKNYTSSDSGNNKTIISKWNLSNLTDNGDETYTPEYISAIERDFIYCTQGQQYHDGMIWAASGYTNHAAYIYAIDPSDGTIKHTVDLSTTTEVEGLAWIDDASFVVGFQGGVYKLVAFETN